jgi:hypothetical protein
MIIAFILALVLELFAEAKTIPRALAYILVPIILSFLVNAIFALTAPELVVTTIALTVALWQRLVASFVGFITGLMIRYLAKPK